jgi:integrase/recombinase XerD
MAKFDLDYVNSFYDRHGKLRHQFRRKGHKKVTLKGRPGTAEFMEQYHALVERTGGAPTDIGAKRTKAGTFNALAVEYYKSDAFTKEIAATTQDMRRAIIQRFRETLAPSGQPYGEKHVATLLPKHVTALLEGRTPDARQNFMKAFRPLMAFAIAKGMRSDDPTAGIKLRKGPKSLGHKTWLEPQIEQYRKHHKLGTEARVAIELLLNIAARRYDAHVIGSQHVIISNKDGRKKLCWRPHKTLRSTAKQLTIPILPALQEALDAMPKGDGTALAFITNEFGRPFASAAAFGNRFAGWCNDAGLKPVICEDGRVRNYRAHGLRKAALRTAAHAQCTLHELMALSGHSSPKQLQEYLEEIEQEFMAVSAIDKVIAAQAKSGTHDD